MAWFGECPNKCSKRLFQTLSQTSPLTIIFTSLRRFQYGLSMRTAAILCTILGMHSILRRYVLQLYQVWFAVRYDKAIALRSRQKRCVAGRSEKPRRWICGNHIEDISMFKVLGRQK